MSRYDATTNMHSVMVFNISYRTSREDLYREFDKFGKIADVYIPRDRYGESRGFGFVRYYNKTEAEEAVSMDGRNIDGRKIGVQLAKYEKSGEEKYKGDISRRDYRSRSRSFERRRYSRSRSRSYDRRRYRSRSRSFSRGRRYSPRYRERGRSRDRDLRRDRSYDRDRYSLRRDRSYDRYNRRDRIRRDRSPPPRRNYREDRYRDRSRDRIRERERERERDDSYEKYRKNKDKEDELRNKKINNNNNNDNDNDENNNSTTLDTEEKTNSISNNNSEELGS